MKNILLFPLKALGFLALMVLAVVFSPLLFIGAVISELNPDHSSALDPIGNDR